MSKLPTLRVASKERPLALPNEVRQALNEAAGRAGGLLAMSVATGLTVMAAMM